MAIYKKVLKRANDQVRNKMVLRNMIDTIFDEEV